MKRTNKTNCRALRWGVAALLLLATSVAANAYDFTAANYDGVIIYYNILSEKDKTCEVTCLPSSLSSYRGAYSGAVVIPETVIYGGSTYSVTTIGDYAFYYCTGLTEVTIPESVTKIGDYAFECCTGLTQVTIPNSVTSMGICAFDWCTRLTQVTIGNSVTSIGYAAFYYTRLTEVTIPESVTSIGSSAFEGSRLTSVTIPNSVKTIGDYAFRYTYLTGELVIPNSVTTIGAAAFGYCWGLTSLTIGNSVTEIGGSAFYQCTGLTEVTIPNSVTSIGSSAFDNCTGLTQVTIGNSVTTIGYEAFRNCTGLTEVTIPESVTSIDSYAFYQCSGLTTINFNATVCTSAGSYSTIRAFYGCSNISTVNFGDNVTMIPAYLCYELTKLTSVTIPNSVTEIGYDAFRECTGLTSIYSLNPKPPTCRWESYVFYNVPTSTCVLYVPNGSKNAYSTASQWKDFNNIVEMDMTPVSGVMADGNAEAVGYYTTDGKQVPTPQRGINIVRYSDGSTRKVLVK